MFVVFGPESSDKKYVEQTILSAGNGKEVDRWNQGGRLSVLMEGSSFADAICSKIGWFLGYAYWDSLPPGYDQGTKNLLEISYELWRKEGIDFLKRLNGSFNLFLHDTISGQCLLSTDRFGTYPVWMIKLENGGFAFSPDSSLLVHFEKKKVDPAGLWSLISRACPIANHTLFQEISGIQQGTAVIIDRKGILSFQEWYIQTFRPEFDKSLGYWAHEFNQCLENAAIQHLSGRKSIGILLSGGTDSRILASYCPPNTYCFTLADFVNRELKTASKIAKICGHKHIPIIRDEDWYANTLIPAAKQCAGLWRWNDAHFLRLEHYPGQWQEIECVVTGIWFDTLFKGCQTPNRLWIDTPNLHNIEKAISFCLEVDKRECRIIEQMKKIMPAEVYKDCYLTYQKALSDELRRRIPDAAHLADAWGIAKYGAIYNSLSFSNIHCLRDFKPVRNLIFDNSIYDIYFRVPAHIRQGGEIIRRALWQRNKRLGLLMDSNTWLPSSLPKSIHHASQRARVMLSRFRNYIYRKTGHTEYRSHGAWTKIAPLWSHNSKMKAIMNDLITNPRPIIEQHFSMDNLRDIWKLHQEGKDDYSEILNSIVGVGLLDV